MKIAFHAGAWGSDHLFLALQSISKAGIRLVEVYTDVVPVYESRADSNASWSRGTSAAGQRCLSSGLRREFQGAAVRLVSFKKLSFPRRGQRSVAYRASLLTQQGLRAYIDVVAMQVSRAQVAVLYSSVLSPPPPGELRRLSGVVAKRAVKAMRGA